MMTRIESARILCFFFFFNDTATTEIYTLSLHDALPISFAGPESFNHYSEWIRTIGEPAVPAQTTLWIIRLVLLAAVVAHMWAAFSLWKQARVARPVPYVSKKRVQQSYASKTLRWGGVVLALVIILIGRASCRGRG